jgi:hypothetical protein
VEQRQAAVAAARREADGQLDLAAVLARAQREAQRALRQAQRALQGEGGYSVGVSGRADPGAAYRARANGGGANGGAEAGALGWGVAALAAAGLLYAALGSRARWTWPWSGGARRRAAGGRWVRDRSLGGRTVFVPDGDDAAATPRPLWDDSDDFAADLAAAAAVRAVSPASPTAGGGAAAAAKDALPEWWAPPAPARYVAAARREELAKQAKRALRALEDAKLLRGEDYSVAGLAALRALCHEGGGLAVRAATESGRDSMLRAAVRAGVEASQRGGDLGGTEPGRFVSGLARDLGVPDRRAVTIAHAEVAATCRSALIDAEAGYRAGDQGALVGALRRLVGALRAFRPPRGSAEAEAVGRGILAQTGVEFRRAVFLSAGAADLGLAPVVAEMCGFDPDLVMPQLQAEVEAAQRAAAAGGGGGGGEGGGGAPPPAAA